MNTSPVARRPRLQLQPRDTSKNWSTTPWRMPRSWAPPTPAPRRPKAAACRCRCARARLENVERNRDKSLGITVYIGQRRGNASTSDFSRAAIEQTVQAAYDIARFTAEDPVAGLPDAGRHRAGRGRSRDLDLFHPWDIDSEQARRARAALRGAPPSTPTSASPTAKAPACRRSRATSSAPTRAAFAAAMPARATRSRSRRSPARATTCSATPGTAPCARRANWPRPRRWAAMPRSARCRA